MQNTSNINHKVEFLRPKSTNLLPWSAHQM